MNGRTVSMPAVARDLLAAARGLLRGRTAYLVGGSLRDRLLALPLRDLDLAVAGDASQLARALADRTGGHYVVLDSERAISRIVLDDGEIGTIDVAPLRGDIHDDLAERDFTIDALAAPIEPLADGVAVEPIDPHGGLDDLANGIIRLVSERALAADPLRLLRAVRLAAQLDFGIEPESANAIRANAGRIGEAAAERQRDELARCFATPRAAPALRMLDELGLLEQLLPEVTAGRGIIQPKEHYWDVFDHAIEAVAALDFMLSEERPAGERQAQFWSVLWNALAPFPELRPYLNEHLTEERSRSALLKLAGLLHDVAKPETRAPDASGRIRFFGHADRGAELARGIMRRFRFSRRETDFVATMVEEHLRPTQLSHEGPPSRRALFRYFRDTGEAAEGTLLLSLADVLAARGPRLDLDGWGGYVAYIAHVLARRNEEEAVARPARLLTGDDVMAALSLSPGPAVGRLLAALEEAHACGDVRTRADALRFIQREQRSGGAESRLPAAASGAAGARVAAATGERG